MERKESIKTMVFGALSLPFLKVPFRKEEIPASFVHENEQSGEPMRSRWIDWPDMNWVGPEYWGNRLQDWRIRDGMAECAVSAPNRTLHLLTHQIGGASCQFSMSVDLDKLNQTGSKDDKTGFRTGARAGDDPVAVEFRDYRRDAVFGVGLEAGIDGEGKLFIGGERSEESIAAENRFRLHLESAESGGSYRLDLRAFDISNGEELIALSTQAHPNN